MGSIDLIYGTYWERKQLISKGVPNFPVIRHYVLAPDTILNQKKQIVTDIQIIIDSVRDAKSLLDVGAGDLRVKRLIVEGGFRGEYHTQDVGQEHEHTYQSLDEVNRRYEAIVCLDVLEHLTLGNGLSMLHRMSDLLEPGGVLVVQTPNALCARNPMAWDMTHVQCYNANDLWAYLQVLGLNVDGYRVLFSPPPRSLRDRIKEKVKERLAQLLRVEHTDNLVMIARKATVGA